MATFTVIDHTELSGAAASWTQASIPSTYDHLYLVMSTRSASGSYWTNLYYNFNGDTGTNYSETNLYANSNGSVQSYRANTGAFIEYSAYSVAGGSLADTFSTTTVWIPNYANTANFKSILTQSGSENNSATNSQWIITNAAALWHDTSAIDEILITSAGSDFVQYSTFTLYGVTGA